MKKAKSVSGFAAGMVLSLGGVAHFAGAQAVTSVTMPLSSFRGAGSFGVTPRLGPTISPGFRPAGGANTFVRPTSFNTAGYPSMPANQWNVRPGGVPGTLPVLNSNTLPAMNSNTLPVLNRNTLPLLNGVNPRYPISVPGVPGVPPGTIPTPPSPPSVNPIQPCPVPPVACPPGWNWWPWGWNGWVAWNGANYVAYWNGFPIPPYVPGPFGGLTYLYDPNLLPGATQRSMAEQQNYPQAPAPTAYDYGVQAFRDRQTAAALKYLHEAVVKDREDTGAMRVLALAMLENRQADDASAMMFQAYKIDPTLAGQNLDVGTLGLNPARRSALINRAVEYANRVNTGSSWLMVSVLMQADGRYEPARRMLRRGVDVGLDSAVFMAMDSALASRIPMRRQNP